MSKEHTRIAISDETYAEAYNIVSGVFAPLAGFMDAADYKRVVSDMHLDNGAPWTIPVTLDVSEESVSQIIKSDTIILVDSGGNDAFELTVEDVYKVNYVSDIPAVFGCDDDAHPGVAKERKRSVFRVGGPIRMIPKKLAKPDVAYLSPADTQKAFKKLGWRTIVGFQTRNPIHRAHEYLQRVGMEVADGIFIQPLTGWKKADDFSHEAVMKAYEKMITLFYPKKRALLGVLKTPMRYAGPREAVFHALIRRNFRTHVFLWWTGARRKHCAHLRTRNRQFMRITMRTGFLSHNTPAPLTEIRPT